MNSFSDLGLLTSLLKTLKTLRISKPTEIQINTIPMILSGQSVVGVSETGSGKTLAYALPLLHKLKTTETEGNPVTENASPRAIIVVPTRELGEQVSKVFKSLTHDTRLRVRPALGGTTFEQSRRSVGCPFEILLATPGRLIQLMEKNLIHLNDVSMIVFDEADQMLDQGFLPDSNMIVNACPTGLQLSLFSATVSPAVQTLMNDLFANAEIFRSSGSGKTVSTLMTKNMTVKDGQRWPIFAHVLAQKTKGGTLVFTNTREQCDKLAAELTEKGYVCGIYRGDMDKNERRANYKKFRDGQIDLLIATDIAGRGLDLDHVGRVINYHLPKQMENYLHRVGRTARAGRPGLVINLVTERDERLMTALTGNKEALKAVAKAPHLRANAKEKSKNPKETIKYKQVVKPKSEKTKKTAAPLKSSKKAGSFHSKKK